LLIFQELITLINSLHLLILLFISTSKKGMITRIYRSIVVAFPQCWLVLSALTSWAAVSIVELANVNL